jgi:hypothetical protein
MVEGSVGWLMGASRILGFWAAPYFLSCVKRADLDELNIEIIRNTLYKEYLEDFFRFCASIGGSTAEVMCKILAVRRVRALAQVFPVCPPDVGALASLRRIAVPSTSPSIPSAQS